MAMVARTPRTPGELFSHLTLNGPPSAVPTITLFPPTPPVELSLSPKVEQPGSARSMRSSPLAEMLSSPSPTSSFGSPQSDPSPAAKAKLNQAKLNHRRLASNEARQLTLLLTQHLWPVRTNAKGLMKESISLAEKLHEAGIRWDKHRRVMGMHLKGGIWEEGVRLGNARMPGGLSAMDLYVQGSFLSVAEEPHPLDPMPIPLEVHPSQFAALPKLTLSHTGVIAALPGMNEHTVPEQSSEIIPQTPLTAATMLTSALSSPVPHEVQNKERKRWRDKKKNGLKIKVDSHRKPRVGAVAIQQPFTAASTRGFALGRMKRWRRFRLGFRLGKVVIDTVPRSARRVSVGGWEVR